MASHIFLEKQQQKIVLLAAFATGTFMLRTFNPDNSIEFIWIIAWNAITDKTAKIINSLHAG